MIPPSKALKMVVNRTRKDAATARSLATPNFLSRKTKVFSLTPNPPIEIGMPISTKITGTIKKNDMKLIFISRDNAIK